MSTKNKRIYVFSIKLLVSSGLLFLLIKLSKIDFKSFMSALEMCNYRLLLPAFIVAVLVLVIKSVRWNRISDSLGAKLPYRVTLSYYFSSFALGVVTPGRLGEFLKVYQLKQHSKLGLKNCFVTVFADRLYDLFVLMTFGLAGLIYFFVPETFAINKYLVITISLLSGILGLSLSKYIVKRLADKFKQGHLKTIFIVLEDSLEILLNRRNYFNWFYTIFGYLFYFGAIWIIFRSFSIQISFADVALIFSVISLILLLPISIAGFGTREAGVVYLLGLYNIPASEALAASLIQFSIFFVGCGAIGTLCFWQGDFKLNMLDMLKQTKTQLKNEIAE